MTDFVLHVGYPKTASSFLQRHAFPELTRQGLIHYIPNAKILPIRNYIVSMDGFGYRPEYILDQLQDLTEPGTNLISCEAFTGSIFYKAVNNFEIARRLNLTFPDAKILITIRKQVSLVHSLYRQYIHEGGFLSFEKFLCYRKGEFHPSYHLDDHRFNLECLKFDRLIEGYQSIFWQRESTCCFFRGLCQIKNRLRQNDCFACYGQATGTRDFDFRCEREPRFWSTTNIHFADDQPFRAFAF